MSITIKLEPQEYVPIYNEVILVLDSTKKNESKFQFVVDVNIDGTPVSRIKIQPNIDGYGVINLGRHLESYVSYNLDHTNTKMFQRIEDSFTKYDVTLSEEYVLNNQFITITDNGGFSQYNFASAHNYLSNDYITVSNSTMSPVNNGNQLITSVPSATSIVTNILFNITSIGDSELSNGAATIIPSAVVMTGDKFAFNGVLSWLDYPDWDSDLYNSNTTLKDFLTTIDDTTNVKLDDRFWINTINDLSGDMKYLEITSDNGVFRIDNNLYSTTSDANKFLNIGVAPFNIINTTNPITVVAGALPILDINTTSYSVVTTDIAGNPNSKTLTFNINNKCSKYDNYRILFLDKFGSFLNMNFDLAHNKKIAVKKTDYKKNYGTYNPTTNTYGWNSYDRGMSRVDTKITESHTIQSNWLNDSESDKMSELIESPEVYHIGNPTYHYTNPLIITGTANTGGFFNYTIVGHGQVVGEKVLISNFVNSDQNGEFTITSAGINNIVIDLPWMASLPLGGTETMESSELLTNGILRAINIDTKSIAVKKRQTDGLINYKIGFTYSNNDTVQRG